MRLFHYTSRLHLERIEAEGVITPTESNISMMIARHGPDVVWLTSSWAWRQGWQSGSVVDKGEVRIRVNVDDAKWWPRWSRSHDIDPDWYRALDKAGGFKSDEWYVVERPIPKEEWMAVEERPL